MTLFEADDYRVYFRKYIAGQPNRGRGELTRIAQQLRVSPTLLSQVLAGTRDLSVEQAFELSQYWGHSSLESTYFSYLVQIARTSNAAYREFLVSRLKSLREQALKLSQRIDQKKTLSAEERSVFYSSWIYSAVHTFCSLKEDGARVDDIMARFHLSRERAHEILSFLSRAGLVREENFLFSVTSHGTSIQQGSPDLIKHHTNWRLKAIAKSENLTAAELMFSGQLSISQTDFKKLRERIVEVIQEVASTVEETKPTDLAVLNIDWFFLD
jgi:uncharacterized protein (TIGR02147 family)